MIHDMRLSSVVPASIAGENQAHRLSNMDLVMKLHYIKAVYFFDCEAARGLTIPDLKKPMFWCLDPFFLVAGRIRVSEDGRPYIKCTDSGVRIAEAKCSKSLAEWFELSDSSSYHQLAYDHVLGPHMGFTPLAFVQFTWFKCGAFSVGLSWAHVLGDAFSASRFINAWAQTMAGQPPQRTVTTNDRIEKVVTSDLNEVPSFLHKVPPGPTEWLITNRCKMQNHSFHVTAKQLNAMVQASKSTKKPFEVISAVIWKSLAKVRAKLSYDEPKNVTVCTRNHGAASGSPVGNSDMTVWTVEAAVPIAEADLSGLAKLIDEEKVDETGRVNDVDPGAHGFILYGANLTFVDLEGLELYGFELKGHKPVFASYSLSGVGDNGAVLVLPAPDYGGKEEEEGGRMVNLILPEDQMEGLKMELKNEGYVL